MSAAGRGAARDPLDRYYTPEWCVDRLLEAVTLPCAGRWLEPAAGGGAIVRACDRILGPRDWTLIDADPGAAGGAIHADFLAWEPPPRARYRVAITNPPYRHAFAFARKMHDLADVSVMLVRLGWLASGERAPWLRQHVPDVYVLPNRPSFTGGGTDSSDYAWVVWGRSLGGHFGVLAETPREERRAS